MSNQTGDGTDTTAFRDSAEHWLGATDQRRRARVLEAEGGGFSRTVWRQMAELGWFSVLVPESDGGLGLGVAEVAAIADRVGRHLPPEPFVDAGVEPLALLARLPPSPLRSHLLDALMAGTCVAAVAWQERAGDLDGDLCTSSAGETVRGASESLEEHRANPPLRVSGRKRFVRPAAVDGWIVSCRRDGTSVLAWVDASAPGVSLETAPGIDGSFVASLHLDKVPAHLLAVGDSAGVARSLATDVARLAQAAELAGAAQRALELTTDYMKTRVQFGRPIGTFQALQHRLVDGLIHVELAHACLREVLDGAADATLARDASRAKARCAHAATEMTRLAIQLHGAIGTTNEYDVGLYFKRTSALAARLGNASSHRLRFARRASAGAETHARTPDAAPADMPVAIPRDADWTAMPEAAFRRLVRAFLTRHYPEQRRHLPYRQTWTESKDWYLALARQGWLAPAWPKAHGGMGLPPDKLIAFIEEFEQHGAARTPDQGLVMIGPILMRFGTPAQRDRFLPPILAGEHVWTQGYSEPEAGSDLAAVRCEAVIDGAHFVVTGQKTWTTWGADGTHMFMLVRTDKSVKKQAGISFLLVDLKSPGITVRPIRNIAGEDDFCEVYFHQVRVPRENLVGELNQGWTIAKALLGHERLFTGSPKHTQYTLAQVERLARQLGVFDEPDFQSRYAALQLDAADLRAAYSGFAELAKRGEPIPSTISMLKIWSTETWERLALLLIETAGDWAALRDHCRNEEIDLHVVAPLFNVMGAKIFAGSNEIQRNILAKTVLDLPV